MSFDSTRYKEVYPIPQLNLADIEEIQCVTPIDYEDSEYHFLCKPKETHRLGCPHCGSFDYYVHGKASDRFVHDVSMGLTKVFIQLQTPRYKCNDCGRTFNHIFETVMQNNKFTNRLYEQIMYRALNEPFTQIATEFELSVPKVKAMMVEYCEWLERNRGPIIAPRVLGIDEKHITHHMRGIFVDIERGDLLEMTEDNRQKTVIDTITSMQNYEKIEIVTMDMANSYKPAIEMCLPNAKIIVDKFHVLADHKRKVQESKKLVTEKLWADINALPAGDDKNRKSDLLTRMGKNNYLFKFGTEKLAAKTTRVSLMAELCGEFPEINTLRLLKEGLERMYEAPDRIDAENKYEDWRKVLKDADKKLFKPFITMENTMRKWYDEIFTYFEPDCRVTNAASEGLNSLIQALNTQGRGYGFKVLRYKSLYHESVKLAPRRFTKKTLVYGDPKTTFAFVDIHSMDKVFKPHWKTETVTIVPFGASIEKLLYLIETDNFI